MSITGVDESNGSESIEHSSTAKNHENNKSEFNIDNLLENYVGPNGLWQWSIVLLTSLSLPSMITFPVFANAVPKFRCKMEQQMEQVFEEANLTFDQTAKLITNWSLSKPDNGCWRFNVNWSDSKWLSKEWLTNIDQWTSALGVGILTNQSCSHGYVYQPSDFQYPSTITEDFDLVCQRSWIGPMGTSFFMFGLCLGFFIGGWIGDKFGRRTASIGFGLVEILATLLVSFAPNQLIYHLSRTLMAVCCSGKGSVTRVLMIELTTARHRSLFMSITVIIVAFVHRAAMAGIAYALPNSWRWFNAVAMSPSLLGLVYFFFLPESPRWLVSQSRQRSALDVLRSGARINKWFKFHSSLPQLPNIYHFTIERPESTIGTNKSNLRKLLINKRSCKLLRSLVTVSMLCSCQTVTMFGIMLYARVIRDSVYIVTLFNASMALPGPLLCSLLYRLFRYRRLPLLICIVLATTVQLGAGIYTHLASSEANELVLNVCANLGLLLVSACATMMTIYSAELFPSSVRSQSTGTANGLARLSSTLVPLINQTDKLLGHGSPMLIFAGLGFVQIVCLLATVDTSGEALADNVKDQQLQSDKPQSEA